MYVEPSELHEAIARVAPPDDTLDTNLPERALGFRVQEYGMTKWRDLFTDRQLVALTTFSDLVGEARDRVRADAVAAGLPDNGVPLRDGGTGATAYAEAVSVYLAFRARPALADYWATVSCRWQAATTRSLRNSSSPPGDPDGLGLRRGESVWCQSTGASRTSSSMGPDK